MSLNVLPLEVLEAVLDQLAESVLITDSAGRILYVNEAFEQLTGYRREEVLGKNPKLLKSGPTFRTPFTPAGNIARPPGGAPRSRDGEPG